MRLLLIIYLCSCYSLTSAAISQQRQQALLNMLRHDCGSCHGLTMAGGLGPALTKASLQGKSVTQLQYIILQGSRYQPMPAFKQILTIEEVKWIVNRLRSGEIE